MFNYTHDSIHEAIRTHSSCSIYMARALDSIRNRFIVFTWLGVNSRVAFWFTTATHKPHVHVHVTSHPDPRGAVHDVQFLESIPPDLAIHECIHRSIRVYNRTHAVTQAIVDDIALAASLVSACLSWLLYLILNRLHSATLKLNLRECHFLLQVLFSSAQGCR